MNLKSQSLGERRKDIYKQELEVSNSYFRFISNAKWKDQDFVQDFKYTLSNVNTPSGVMLFVDAINHLLNKASE
jgi:hypothetical protein